MRQLGRLGLWYPIDRLDGAGIRRLLRTVEDLGYSTLWYPEAVGYESLAIASFMLANTTRLIIDSSIANIYARDLSRRDAACTPCPASMMIASSSASASATRPWSRRCAVMSMRSPCRRCAAISTASMKIRRTRGSGLS